MIIEFYRIEGISEEDTPYSSGGTGDIRLFLTRNKIVKRLDSNTYYPPHYRNTIKVLKDDVNYSTTMFNYIGLYYDNIWYYYFVDKINYINEDVYSVDIHMDTITTFLSKSYIYSCIVERQHINRWVQNGSSWYINRDYVRENFSNADFKIEINKQFSNSNLYDNSNHNIRGMYVAICTASLGSSPAISYGFQYSFGSSNVGVVNSPYTVCFIPDTLDGNYQIGYLNTTPNNYEVIDTLYKYAIAPECVQIYYLPSYLLLNENIVYNSNNSQFIINTISGSSNTDYTISNGALMNEHRDNVYHAPTFYYILMGSDREINFQRNIYSSQYFEVYYEPALLDENYIKITFGDKSSYTTYPLYQLTLPNLRCEYTPDILSGGKRYNLTGNAKTINYTGFIGLYDESNTCIVNGNAHTIDLVTNEYKTWASRNRATGYYTFVNGVVDVVGSFIGEYKQFDRLMSTQTATIRDINQYERGTQSGYTGAIKNALSLHETAINKVLQPNGFKSNGTYANALLTNIVYPSLVISKVQDYDKCCMMYRKFGYKVDKPYYQSTNSTYPITRNRYYFNYYKLRDITLDITSYVEDDYIKNDIIRRLENGIRLWYFDYETGVMLHGNECIVDYRYDNVETSYME